MLCLSVSLDYFNQVGAYLCQSDSSHAFDENHNASVALTLHLHECAFHAVKCASVYTYLCALFQVNLLRTQVYEFFVGGVGRGNELRHLLVGDCDRGILAILRSCHILQEISASLQLLYCGF